MEAEGWPERIVHEEIEWCGYWGEVPSLWMRSSIRQSNCCNSRVTQMVEYLALNEGVEGSSPFTGTSNNLLILNP